jgi:hypothetical protein
MRLGHPSPPRLRLASLLLPSKTISSNNNCSVCPMAKETRLSFPLSLISTKTSFDLLHCDIWGPHKIPTHSGARFFLTTIVDDFTRCTWIFFMQHKSETQNLLKSFVVFAQTQFHANIKTIRVDNGSEFFSMREFFQNHGIAYQHTCVYTPQQNRVVECKYRHILTVTHALLFQSHLPLIFWGDCVLTAVYLINRLPSPLLSNKSPFEFLYNRPPSFDHLRVFGCLCYATVVHPIQKFEPRATRCVFVGYPTGQKGYKLYNLETNKFFVSRDVRFCEHSFPFSQFPASSTSQTPPLSSAFLDNWTSTPYIPNPPVHPPNPNGNPSHASDIPPLLSHLRPPYTSPHMSCHHPFHPPLLIQISPSFPLPLPVSPLVLNIL